ncbi:MAG: SDR family NAD(P)-dependent oxidoreductase [Myxococcales bacterium]|nr:SDR family NAD(P)-dependent oxidoreductase [Myxococcales bacterium]
MRYRTALITGASSGIGRSLAHKLAQQGTHVVVCARREAELAALVEAIRKAGGAADALVLDVADVQATRAAIQSADARLAGLDLVVANAGVGAPPSVPPWSWEALGAACQINFLGAAATLTAVLPQMLARGHGHLVGVSSLASFGALPQAAAYCAPKAGLSMLLDCLRLDLHGTGVAVTTIHVGFVRTAMLEHATHRLPQLMEIDAAVDAMLRRLPDRPAEINLPQPLAFATRFLARLPRWLREPLLRAVRPS